MNLREMKKIVKLGKGVKVLAEDVKIGSNVRIEDYVNIRANRLRLGDDVHIGQEVKIESETIEIGFGSRIEAKCRLSGMEGAAHIFCVGEQTSIGHDSKLLVPVAIVGDYTSIHNHCLLNGRQPLMIGHNVWIGQNCIINAEDKVTIGNNVGIGPYSMIYTHGYFGDLLEGCQVFKIAPTVIEDDVWILGSNNVISPGVKIGKKSLILTGSVVTKDIPSNQTFGGSPARNLSNRIIPYRELSGKEKFSLISRFIKEFVGSHYRGEYTETENGFIVDAPYGPFRIMIMNHLRNSEQLAFQRPLLIFCLHNDLLKIPNGITIFDLTKREYMRARSKPEIEVIKFLKSYRARFVPADNPRIYLSNFDSK